MWNHTYKPSLSREKHSMMPGPSEVLQASGGPTLVSARCHHLCQGQDAETEGDGQSIQFYKL